MTYQLVSYQTKIWLLKSYHVKGRYDLSTHRVSCEINVDLIKSYDNKYDALSSASYLLPGDSFLMPAGIVPGTQRLNIYDMYDTGDVHGGCAIQAWSSRAWGPHAMPARVPEASHHTAFSLLLSRHRWHHHCPPYRHHHVSLQASTVWSRHHP